MRKKKKKAFLSLLSTFCLLFSFIGPLFVHLSSCFVVLLFSKAPKWREKSQKDWDSYTRAPAAGKASGDEAEDHVFFLLARGRCCTMGTWLYACFGGHGRVVF